MTFQELTQSIYINGSWEPIDTDQVETIYNPATLEEITKVAYGGADETKRAIKAATDAFPLWSEMTGRERGKVLYKAHELMMERVDYLAEVLTTEQGKPLAEAKGEVTSAAQFLLWYAEEASRAYGEVIPSATKGKRMLVIPQPVGVVGAITPWNFPSSMITRKLGPALAAGCTAVLKPAPETPLSAIEIFKIFAEAGMPKGVINLVTGDAEAIGQTLLESKDVKMITFTGSTAVGKYLMRESANHVKKISLELGGHAPIIVYDDADIDKATSMSLASKFRNNGQTCVCANRIYVHENIIDEFTTMLKEKVNKLKVGSGLDANSDIGPLINEQAIAKVKSQLEDAASKGGEIVTGGNAIEGAGHFFEPTIVAGATDEMVMMNEETFGPLMPIQTFTDEDAVIAKANDTDYGLAAYVFTENLSKAVRTAERLEYGLVGVNEIALAAPEAPFGGIKQSGVGKEGGHHGMDEFLEKKYVAIGIDEK